MILGLFGGVTKSMLKRSQDRLARHRAKLNDYEHRHNGDVEQALADRAAAIEQLREEVLDISRMKTGVSWQNS